MTLIEHQDLWNKIQQFAFDEPNATITFSKKLAEQQKWTPAYTELVIEEYRKFIFLCCISPNGAAPSKPVDEVWHLHLTYTQSYWNAFCKNTLGKDIHHYPSNGGEQEDHKHATWYNDTLKLYKSVFGTIPSADCWPRPAEQQVPIDVPWAEPELKSLLLKDRVKNVVMLLLAPSAISLYFTGIFFPYSLKGEQFLYYYAMVVAVALITFYLLQKKTLHYMKQTVDARFPTDVSVFQLAQFLYGKQRAIQTCLVDLYRRNLVVVDDKAKIVVYSSSYQAPGKEENPLIPALLASTDGSTADYDTIGNDWYKLRNFEHPGLERLFSITDQKGTFFQRYLVIIVAASIGIIRVIQGTVNHRPVQNLEFEIALLAGGTYFIYYKFSSKNVLFNKVEEKMMEKAGDKSLHADEVVRDYALNGQAVLNTLPQSLIQGTIFAAFPAIAAAAGLSNWNNARDTRWVDDNSSNSSLNKRDSNSSSGSSGGGGCGGCGGSNNQ